MSEQIRIRMYQAGFGDCFLLHLPTEDGPKTMLVDCGSLGGGEPGFKDVVGRLLQDVGNHIDVIVATHRHRDHISGFEYDGWKNVTATEVWMPWTERPDDADALRIRSAQERLARSLHDALPANADDGLRFLAENALTNEKARDRLLRLGAGATKLRWIACEAPGVNAFQTPALPGVEVYVLGPLRDKKTFGDMEPPTEQNFAHQPGVAAGAAGAERGGGGAFSSRWRVSPGIPSLSAEEINLIRQAIPDVQFELLALNDHLINSTSIMLVLRIGDTHLLLPGDAQWSTWKAALADPGRRALLAKTHFYKVGHHASENATPIEFASDILKNRTDVTSMASWVKRANWERIPEEHLVDRLREIGPFADHETKPLQGPFTADPESFFIEATVDVA